MFIANILGYQQDRKNRLFHACAQEETEITKIKEEEEGLLKLLEEERKTNEGVDSEMVYTYIHIFHLPPVLDINIVLSL